MGTRQRYALGAASPTGELGAAALALSRPALHALSGQRCDAWAACLRAAHVPLLHCGHLVEDGAAYRRGAGGASAALLCSPSPPPSRRCFPPGPAARQPRGGGPRRAGVRGAVHAAVHGGRRLVRGPGRRDGPGPPPRAAI